MLPVYAARRSRFNHLTHYQTSVKKNDKALWLKFVDFFCRVEIDRVPPNFPACAKLRVDLIAW